MATAKKSLRTCKNGHQYFKGSDCPVCPICEQAKKPTEGFLSVLSAPARRALENNGINTLKTLSAYSKTEVLSFHGIGKASIPVLETALREAGLSFKE